MQHREVKVLRIPYEFLDTNLSEMHFKTIALLIQQSCKLSLEATESLRYSMFVYDPSVNGMNQML